MDILKPKEQFVGKTSSNAKTLKDRWWTESTPEDIGKAAWSVADSIFNNQSDRQLQYAAFSSMYSSYEYTGTTPTMRGLRGQLNGRKTLSNRVTWNVIKACVDTAAAKIASNRPRPMFLTVDGDWSLKKKAESLTQYMDGVFDDISLYPKMQQAFVDAAVFGTGCVKFYIHNDKICSDNVWIEDLLVDDTEAQYGNPRQLHQVRLMHREVLMEMFPDKASIIASAATGVQDALSTSKDMLLVAESWHLPSGDPQAKKTDGVHVISIREATLFVEEYRKDFFPFVFVRWSPRLRDFYGQGIAEELFGTQIEINRILKNIQVAMRRVAQPRTFLENGSMVIKQHLTDQPGSIVSYSGTKPIFETPTAMNPETYQHLDRLYNKAFEIVGVSQLAASAKKPAGLDAGVAIREMNDIQSERFLLVGQRLEKAYIEAAAIIADLSKTLYTNNPKLSVKVKNNKVLSNIKWKDVFIPEDKYILNIYPTSLLPTTPAAKKQTVIELMQAGLIDKDIALDLLDFPDLKRASSLQNAAVNDAMEILEKIVEEGVYQTPEQYMNLKLCVALGQSMYLKARQSGVSEERLELLRRFIDDSNELDNMKQVPPEQVAPAQEPIASPMPAPQSPMLPIT